MDLATVTTMPLDEIYDALRSGQCDVGEVLRTDGRVAAWDFSIVADDLGAFPNFTPAPIARRDLLTTYPELEAYLGQLGPILEPAVMTGLNAAVDLGQDGEPATGDEAAVADVAQRFLCEHQLITTCVDGFLVEDSPTVPVEMASATDVAPFAALIPMTSTADLLATSNGAEAADSADADAAAIDDGVPAEGENTGAITETVAPDTTVPETIVAETPVTETVVTRTLVPETAATDTLVTGTGTTDTNGRNSPADVVTVTTPDTFGVNARAAASPAAEIVAILPRNTVVEAVGRTADSSWLQIVLADGRLAWVFAAAILTSSETIQQLPVNGT